MLKWLLGLLLIGLLGVVGGLMGYQALLQQPLAASADGELLLVRPGASFRAVATEAAGRGWLKHPQLVAWVARIDGRASRIRAGEYRMTADLTLDGWLSLLSSGQVVQRTVTLVEGRHLREVLAALRAEPLLRQDLPADFPAGDWWRVLGLSEASLLSRDPEGLFFPDTYAYVRATPVSAILRRAHERLRDILQQEWQLREPDLPYESPYEALIMASVIEKETGVPDERSQIAGVFVRRLQRGMRLQTDPTVIYGLGPLFDGNLRRRHLKDADNRFNTYRHKGLPPTPIALAGRDAIHAALHPQPGKTLYFVAKGDGSHVFSETLQQHEAAVRQYQLRRRSDYRSSPAPAQ